MWVQMPASWINFRIYNRFLVGAALALVLTGAVSCSTVWDEVSGFIEDDESIVHVLTNSGDNDDFPKLSEVPNTPRPASTPEDLERLGEGLIADRGNARHTNETLRSRYADQIDEYDERLVERQVAAAASSLDQVTSPAQLRAQESSNFVDQDQFERSLLDEGRDSGIEPVSNQPTTLRETRVAVERQSISKFGVMEISKFRELFNARFEASGRSPYQNSLIQPQTTQITSNEPVTTVTTDRTVSRDSTDIVRAQIELAESEPPIASFDSASDLTFISFQAATIQFGVGSSSLNLADRTALKSVAKLHEQFGGVVRVIGHSSKRTRDMEASSRQMVNFQLSLDRATAVSVELARIGVPVQAVIVMARSDNEPLTHEYMPRGEAENRRADIYIEY